MYLNQHKPLPFGRDISFNFQTKNIWTIWIIYKMQYILDAILLLFSFLLHSIILKGSSWLQKLEKNIFSPIKMSSGFLWTVTSFKVTLHFYAHENSSHNCLANLNAFFPALAYAKYSSLRLKHPPTPPPLIPFPTRSFLHLDYFVIITPCKFEAFCGSLNFPEVKFGCNISHHHLFFALWKHFLHFFPFLIKKKGSCGSWSHVSLTAKWFLFTSPATCHSNTETWIAQKPTKEHTHTFTEVLDWCNALSN